MKQILTNTLLKDKLELLGIDLDWLIGFIEAESSISISEQGYSPSFTLTQHVADYNLMERIKFALDPDPLGYENLYFSIKDKDYTCSIKFQKLEQIIYIIIPLLTNRLHSVKRIEQFNKWRQRPDLNDAITNCTNTKSVINSKWFSGLVDGDGSFHIMFKKASDIKVGYQVQLVFDITQFNELDLLNQINEKFFDNHGKIVDKNCRLKIYSPSLHRKYVVPLFKNNPLMTRKSVDFKYWTQVLTMVENGEHLTTQGFSKIRDIRIKMLLNRVGFSCYKNFNHYK